MIVVKLKGGLGNQLFQYALGRHLAEIHGTILKTDISFFNTYKLHAYSIGPFNIQENFASTKEIRQLTFRKQGVIGRVMTRALRKPEAHASTYVKEKVFQFDPDMLNLSDGVYLDGYWQSEKYFTDIAKIIRREITVKSPQLSRNKEIANLITSCESVSIHIRRGSYLLPQHNAMHGLCSLSYYHSCVDYIVQSIKNPHFFVFSDDPEWTRENLNMLHPTRFLSTNNAEKDYEDIRLMSKCKYHIIANSTFSWWGAWLSNYPEKIVIAPKRWYGIEELNNQTYDLIPDTWIRL